MRYYLSDVIGTGRDDDPYRAALLDRMPAGMVARCSIPAGGSWCVVEVDLKGAKDYTAFEGDPRVIELPDGDISALKRVELTAALTLKGIDTKHAASKSGADLAHALDAVLSPSVPILRPRDDRNRI